MELRQYALIILKRWWLIALTTVLAAGAALGVSITQTPLYRATVRLEVDRGSDPSEDPYYAMRNAEVVAGTYVVQATSPNVVEAVVARLALTLPVERVQDMLSASQVGDSGMFDISAQNADPALAQALAQTTAEVLIEQKQAQQAARYEASLADLEAQITELERQIMETRAAMAELGDEANLSPYGRGELARLETQRANDQTRLTVLLNSTEQFRLQMARSGDYITIFSPAKLPTAPFAPQILRNTALATVVGGMIGVGVAFLLDYLDDTLHTPEDAQQALGVNVLAAVPATDDAEGWIAQSRPLSPVAEAFRNLRTSLQYASLDAPLRTLLVTSTEPGEGKSFVTSNLATAFAVNGKKVLLIDADLRRPTLHRLWDETRSPGLSDSLVDFSQTPVIGDKAGTTAIMSFIRTTPVSNLFLLTAGVEVTTPAELLNSQTFQRMIAVLLDHFDLIVLDAPPVLTVTDAAVLAGNVDGVMMVTVSGETRLPTAARAIDRIQSVGGTLLGLVVNRLTAGSGGYYYHYYRYSYDYSYHHDGVNSQDGARPGSGKRSARGRARAEKGERSNA